MLNQNDTPRGTRSRLKGPGRAAAPFLGTFPGFPRIFLGSLGAALTLLLASPTAHALTPDDGDDPGTGLSIFETLSLFVITPILLFAVIAALVVLGEKRR